METSNPTTKKPKHIKLKKPKVFSSGSVYIDPHHCASKVAHLIRRDEYGNYYGNIELHDCGRQINWQLNLYSEKGRDDAIAKVRAARAALYQIQSAMERLKFKPEPTDDEKLNSLGANVASAPTPR